MTISPNRIRYLDKENKVLVQDFSDLSVNVPITNVETPMTIEAMDAIDEDFRYLQSIQREILDIVDLLTSENIGQALIDTLLNNLRLNIPGFPQIAMFIQSLRDINPNALGGIVNALMGEIAGRVIDNPLLINRNDKNVQQQLINLAMTDFAKKLQSGQITQDYINRLAQSSAVEDPYAIQRAIDQLNRDFQYNTTEQAKFRLPNEKRVADTVIAHISISLAYFNYYYTKIRLDKSLLDFSDFNTHGQTGVTSTITPLLDTIKTELSVPLHDTAPTSYYYNQLTSKLLSGLFQSLTEFPNTSLFKPIYADVQRRRLEYLRSQTTGKTTDPLKETFNANYAPSLLSRLPEYRLPLTPTTAELDEFKASLTDEVVFHLQSVLLQHLKAGKASTDALKLYILANAKATVVDYLIQLRSSVQADDMVTYYMVLSVLEGVDIYEIEGIQEHTPYGVRLALPVISFKKMEEELLYKTLLEQLRLLDRQMYIDYPKDQTLGLIEKIVTQVNETNRNLINNHPFRQDLLRDEDKTWVDLKATLLPQDFHAHFFPIRHNTYDKEIYTHYQRDLKRLIYTEQDVVIS